MALKKVDKFVLKLGEKRTETHACDCIDRADVEQTVEDNILCYTHSDRPIDQDPDTECHKAIRTALRMLRKDLRKLPSAQPIIRCKECKYAKHWYRDKAMCFLWHETGIDVYEDGFCNYAERRTDEGD